MTIDFIMFPFIIFKVALNGSRSPNDRKYKPVDDDSPQAKLRENKNPNNKKNHGVINSTSKKKINIVVDSMIKHVNLA